MTLSLWWCPTRLPIVGCQVSYHSCVRSQFWTYQAGHWLYMFGMLSARFNSIVWDQCWNQTVGHQLCTWSARFDSNLWSLCWTYAAGHQLCILSARFDSNIWGQCCTYPAGHWPYMLSVRFYSNIAANVGHIQLIWGGIC